MKAPIHNLEYLTTCPLCNKKYGPVKALVLEEKENKTVLHLTCANCQAATLVFVSFGQAGLASVGMATDIVRDEAKKFFGGEEISSDKVLEIHELLEKTTTISELY